MEGHCSTGQSPQWAVVPMEEEEEEEEEEDDEEEEEVKRPAGFGAHLVPWGSLPGLRRLRSEGYHSPPASTKANDCSYTSAFHIPPWHAQGQLYFMQDIDRSITVKYKKTRTAYLWE